MFDKAILILQLAVENNMIEESEGKSAIHLLKVRPTTRINKIARDLSLVKDTYHKFWAADEGLRHMTRMLEDEIEILRSLMLEGGDDELEKEKQEEVSETLTEENLKERYL